MPPRLSQTPQRVEVAAKLLPLHGFRRSGGSRPTLSKSGHQGLQPGQNRDKSHSQPPDAGWLLAIFAALAVLGVVESEIDKPLPRPKRQRRRARSDRGLPPDEELFRLAKTYLEQQRELWPEVVNAGLLPDPTPEILVEMADDFKLRHRTGEVDISAVRNIQRICSKLGGLYARYSCDNSSTTSILDQTANGLEKSHREGRFIPWQYLFADYSVTGLDAARQGYSSYKAVLGHADHLIETTYIDDFTRASRDEIEWWKLAALSKRLNKRMIGASDGFDLNDPNSDLLITMFGLVSRLFIRSLREKVKRGMKGGARRGTCLGKLPLGFTRRIHRDENGNAVQRANGKPRTEICVDLETSEHRRLLFTLFVKQGWSVYQITRHFNQLKVDGWAGWTESALKKLLWSPTAIGVFIWNRTRREFDLEEEKWVKVENPHSEWEVHYDADLAIVPLDLWKAARKKLAEMRANNPLTGRKRSRNQFSATTLFSGTLFCGYCNDELKLIRSTEKYKQFGCLNGPRHACDCQLTSSKSTAIIENCLLDYLRKHVITEEAIEGLVARANAFLAEEAEKPQIDITPIRGEAKKLDDKIRKLILRVEDEENEDLCAVYGQRIVELRKKLKPLHEAIRDAERQNRKKDVQPLTVERCLEYLSELREVLTRETPMAAEAIRTLTGPITIRQEPIAGKKRGARWMASFSPDLVRLLQQISKSNDVPDSIVLETVESTTKDDVVVPIEKIPKYEALAPEFKRLRDQGASVQSIASAHGMTRECANQVLHFAETGERPKWKAGKRTGNGSTTAKYIQHADEVTRFRDKQKMSFTRIASQLKLSASTVQRAYDHAHRDAIRECVERGEQPDRGEHRRLDGDVFRRVRELLRAEEKPPVIASEVGCGVSTVYRERKKLLGEMGDDSVD